jgi:putative mRNA 3-end processing factor
MASENLLELTDRGLYCARGDFYIDPWYPVPRAVVTHAHGDHCAPGSESYLVARAGEHVFRARLTDLANLQLLDYGEEISIMGVKISLHPAGHILGSAQVRLEYRGEVWVVSGDYKLEPDATCAPFELVNCNVFVTESTFGLPIYRWPDASSTFTQINAWWRDNQAAGRTSMLFGYPLGKSQRLIAGVDSSIGPIYTHGQVERLNLAYRQDGVPLPQTTYVGAVEGKPDWSKGLIVAPPSAAGSMWLRRFGDVSTGFASGWMRIRGTRRRRALDRGFVMSDHADWPGLMDTITATGAERVRVTHGYVPVMVKWLREQGIDAKAIPTRFTGEELYAPEEEGAE